MMDVIKSDFERTISTTQKAEKEAAAEFLAFETETKSSIAQKTVSKRANTAEKEETENTISEDNTSLTEEQKLFDSAIQQIMELQPACVDTGMSYEERVAKTETTIDEDNTSLVEEQKLFDS